MANGIASVMAHAITRAMAVVIDGNMAHSTPLQRSTSIQDLSGWLAGLNACNARRPTCN
jgi:hypothetical protein